MLLRHPDSISPHSHRRGAGLVRAAPGPGGCRRGRWRWHLARVLSNFASAGRKALPQMDSRVCGGALLCAVFTRPGRNENSERRRFNTAGWRQQCSLSKRVVALIFSSSLALSRSGLACYWPLAGGASFKVDRFRGAFICGSAIQLSDPHQRDSRGWPPPCFIYSVLGWAGGACSPISSAARSDVYRWRRSRSPNKTWEGALGNLFASLLVAVACFARWMEVDIVNMMIDKRRSQYYRANR